MKFSVYLETSFVSYLVARPSRTILGAAHQEVTREWWENHRDRYDLKISELVVRECSAGDAEAAAKRVEIIREIPRLAINTHVENIAKGLLRTQLVPPQAAEDALHIAIAAAHSIDFVLTWNFKHIANPSMQRAIARYLNDLGLAFPFICSPEEMLGEDDGSIM